MTKALTTKSETNCKPNAPVDTSVLSLEPPPSVVINPDVASLEDFLKAVKAGIQCWELAGQILVGLKEQDPGIFKKIMTHAKWMTSEILWSFHRIGEGKLYPQVMLLRKCEADTKLLACDYDTQRRLCNEPIQVAIEILKDGSPRIEQRWIQEIGKETIALVFKGKTIRPINEQVDILRERKKWAEHRPVFQPPAIKATPSTPATLNSVGQAFQKKITALGIYAVQWKDGEPILAKIKDRPLITQQILLKEDGLKQLGGIIEFTQWK